MVVYSVVLKGESSGNFNMCFVVQLAVPGPEKVFQEWRIFLQRADDSVSAKVCMLCLLVGYFIYTLPVSSKIFVYEQD